MTRRGTVELEDLRERLREAEETLAAIRNGEVDSLIVTGPQGDQVFSLKGAEQPYRVFVEQMLEGAVTLTPQGTILYCNRRFAEMVRSRLEKVIGAQLQSFVSSADQQELGQILREPDGRKARYVLTATDGTFIPTQLAFSKLPVEEEVDAICLVVTDMTEQEERKELAAAMERLRAAQDQLQHQNDELAKARADAEAANEAKDQFLAALSHELRTPLTPVLMTVESLQADETLPPRVREELALLRRNVELEARLIDDLLDLTRIVRGKIELKGGIVDVHELLASTLEIIRSDTHAKRISVTQDLRASNPMIEGDGVRVQQILWNLVRNAVKFTPSGGRISIRSSSDAEHLRIEVTDTGIGIDPQLIDRIFAPFEQTGRAITQQFGGLGLGLTISKRLAELHSGSISARSEGRDRGATFTLTLPLARAVGATARACGSGGTGVQVKIGSTDPAMGSEHKRLRILLVEDHDDTRRSMARLLASKHAVRDVKDVASALSAAREEPFDLVISDLGLPDGSGLDLMRQLRDLHDLKGICLSGFGMEEDITRSAQAGFTRHLTKPVDLQKLESAIESLAN